jgi:hypothetical protein
LVFFPFLVQSSAVSKYGAAGKVVVLVISVEGLKIMKPWTDPFCCPLPSDEVTIWLEAMLPAHYLDGHNLWIFSARADLAFLIDRSVFIAHWNRLLPLAREAAFILPRDESWLLLWEHQGFLTVYRRNPQPLV